jgi:leucyl-tRNA synthetase
MEYNFRGIEKKWQEKWKDDEVYKVSNDSPKPKYYVLDMFPYPSGAGLHVGHPLGYIASDIFARYKRLKGFNVLHPMGYDAFGLPAEQYAIEHGIHPAVSTEQNIKNFRAQLDKIGFCFDWSREVNTSHPEYYKWTQWIFLKLFKSFYNRKTQKAESIDSLINVFEKEGNANHLMPVSSFQLPVTSNQKPATSNQFSSADWNSFDELTQQTILMEYRLAYCGYGEVNWCEALGTVLANDEVINGVSERGGYPVVKKKLRQWYLRITEYADRLLEGLQTVDFSEAMKEMQSNWIGKSYGAEIDFAIKAPSQPSPVGKGSQHTEPAHYTADPSLYAITKQLAVKHRNDPTREEEILWQRLKGDQTGSHIRRQHIIGSFIVDFVCIDKMLTIEIDGGYHNDPEQKKYDESRTEYLKQKGFTEIRFTNEDVKNDLEEVVNAIRQSLKNQPSIKESKESTGAKVSPEGGDLEGASLRVYTTRPDTIFGVDFMVIAPEHELISSITTKEQQQAVDEYITYVKSRSDRERQAEKKITGCFTGAFAINPFNKKEIPIWISEYVLAGYGTGAIMAVPCGDERDFKFAKHFNIPITNIIGKNFNGEEANATKDAILENSGFLNGIVMRDAIEIVNNKIEELGIGKKKVNYKMRDAAFSRQRYWGEPFPIVWTNGIAYPLDENELPLILPEVEKYGPGPDGEGPLANLKDWASTPQGTRETNTMPGYAGSSWYFLRYMDPHNNNEFCSRKASDYWGQVDLYIGGTEHAVGHLLYSRMWTKALYDLNFIGHDEPYKKLVNQGMIQGSSRFVYRLNVSGIERMLGEFLQSNFTEYTFVTGDFDESRLFDYRGHFEGKTYGIEISNFQNLKSKQKRYLDLSGKNEMIGIFISNGEFLWQFCYGNLKKWFGEILQSRVNYVSEFEKSIALYISKGEIDKRNDWEYDNIHIDVNIVDGVELDVSEFKKWKNGEFADAEFILEDGSVYSQNSTGKYICGTEVEKMSKRYFNTVNPNDLCERYGADTFRMYEMFLGPVEQSKPWDTKGIEGVHRFLKKLWRLFYDENAPLSARRGVGGEAQIWNEEKANDAELKVLHKTIKKIEEDTERFSFNTGVSAAMIAVNELSDLKCNKKEILEPLLILLTPYAPHICEELWHLIGNTGTILDASYPKSEEKYLKESTKNYPIAFNGRTRAELNISLDATQQQVEEMILSNEALKKWFEGKLPKKIIYVKNKMINVVI